MAAVGSIHARGALRALERREEVTAEARRLPRSADIRPITSASCSSSASRGSGRSSSRTRAIAAGSSAPRSCADAGSLAAARVDRLRPPLLERRVVQKRVRPGVQNFVRQRRRLGRVARDQTDVAGVNARQDPRQAVEVHRLFETVANRLGDERMIGKLPIAGNVLQAGGGVGKDRRQQIVGQHALQRRRHLAAAAEPRHGQRNGRVPAPARLEHRRVEQRLHQDVLGRRRMQIAEDVGERKRMLRPERQQQRVFGGRRLQLEIELPAEALAQRQAPRLVDAAAERRVQHELHAAGFVEEALEDQRVLRRDDAERRPRVGEIGDGLLGGEPIDAGLVGQPVDDDASDRRRRAASHSSGWPRARPRCRARSRLTALDSSSLRAGASPSQNGMFGGAPFASATRITPAPTCRTRHDMLPS